MEDSSSPVATAFVVVDVVVVAPTVSRIGTRTNTNTITNIHHYYFGTRMNNNILSSHPNNDNNNYKNNEKLIIRGRKAKIKTTATGTITTSSSLFSSSGGNDSNSINNNNEKKKTKKRKNKNNNNININSNPKNSNNTKQKKTSTLKQNPATVKKQNILQQIKAKIRERKEEQQQENKKKKSNNSNNKSKSKKKKNQALVVNPFQVGRNLRETIDSLGRGLQLPKETKEKYFMDDRLRDIDTNNREENNNNNNNNNSINDILANRLLRGDWYNEAAVLEITDVEYIPEVLVIGATGELGRLVVRRLVVEGLVGSSNFGSSFSTSTTTTTTTSKRRNHKFRVRVLVRDLYSQTLQLLGTTGVSYCQGDLSNIESLEYAVTDVDKIVFVAEQQQQNEQHDEHGESSSNVLKGRAQLAEQVDCIGMKNLISAYQNVRVTDYGTSQAAKRTLFKFSKNSKDFDLFTVLDDDNDDDGDGDLYCYDDEVHEGEYDDDENDDDNNDDDDDDEDDEENYSSMMLESQNAARNIGRTQVRWLRNKFDCGVFVGKVLQATIENSDTSKGGGGRDGEAAIMSNRIRAREDPTVGIDLSKFAGFIIRLVSGGTQYEAVVRTGLYETKGIEYVSEFSTDRKPPTVDNKSPNRFKTVRLAFDNFKAVQQQQHQHQHQQDQNYDSNEKIRVGNNNTVNDNINMNINMNINQSGSTRNNNDKNDDDSIFVVPPFIGNDVRYVGFRFRSSSNNKNVDDNTTNNLRKNNREQPRRRGNSHSNTNHDNDNDDDDSGRKYQSFYLSLSYIKVYRAQPEPEFIYLSDARIPPVIRNGMVHHQRRVLLTDNLEMTSNNKEKKKKKKNDDHDDGGGRGDERSTFTDTATSTLLDEREALPQQKSSQLLEQQRSTEETYCTHRGEEILIKSGLSYTIIRVAAFNDLSTSEASTIELVNGTSSDSGDSDTAIVPVSRAEVAQVCVSALLDPSALNKCVYMTKKKTGFAAGTNVLDEEDISAKFDAIPSDNIL